LAPPFILLLLKNSKNSLPNPNIYSIYLVYIDIWNKQDKRFYGLNIDFFNGYATLYLVVGKLRI